MSKQLVIYIAGPYRAETERGVVLNIRKAEDLALEVWRRGHAVLCPHKNTALLGGACPDETWLRGDITLMLRCDAVLLVEGWERSSGTRAEVDAARAAGLPVFEALDELEAWAKTVPTTWDHVRLRAVALTLELQALTGYAETVRLDRRDSSGEMAEQTVEWCEGLLEQVKSARAVVKHIGMRPTRCTEGAVARALIAGAQGGDS